MTSLQESNELGGGPVGSFWFREGQDREAQGWPFGVILVQREAQGWPFGVILVQREAQGWPFGVVLVQRRAG